MTEPPLLPVLRIIGEPGAGKSLLILGLTDELRRRGYRVSTAEERNSKATVVVLGSGGRVTLERTFHIEALRGVVAGLDPQADVLLAEGYEGHGVPAIEVSPPGGAASLSAGDDLLAVVSGEELRAAFEGKGPSDHAGIADLVESTLLGERSRVERTAEAQIETSRRLAEPVYPADGGTSAPTPAGRAVPRKDDSLLGRLRRRLGV